MKSFMAIAGNIGVGKSSLTLLLAKAFGYMPVLEIAEANPYLSDFYHDMPRWGFHSQLFFLTRRLQQHLAQKNRKEAFIQDRTLYEDAEILAQNLYENGCIPERDWRLYRDIYEIAIQLISPPDLIIYLKASVSTLVKRITKRSREAEFGISPTYLEQLNDLYDRWHKTFHLCPVITIETDQLDFVHNPADFSYLIQTIEMSLRLD